jgi:hypothetical protein
MEPEMTPEEERQRTQALLTVMSRHVAMAAFVGPPPATPNDVKNNGTVSFVNLLGGKFLITNHHVWYGFKTFQESNAGARLAVTGEGRVPMVDITTVELVDEDAGLDLAILKYDRNEIIESAGNVFYVPKRWPLDTALDGDDVVVVGYPGKRRNPTQEELKFESVLLGLKILSVSDRKYMLGFTNPDPIVHVFSSRPIEQWLWGGMSGSMVYRLDLNSNQFYVTGFLHAAGEGLNTYFFASRADLINEDGTIRR